MRRTAYLLTALLALGCDASPDEGTEPEKVGEAPLAAESLTAPSRPNAIRLLEQATFGPKIADIDHVMTQGVGISGFVTEQLAKPAGTYTGWDSNPNANPPVVGRDPSADIFEHAIGGNDQLRQRVALALSQILVVSNAVINNNAAIADYLTLLRKDAFGNFRTLMYDVTVHPAMGKFLNMANNVAFDATPEHKAVAPDENYARELMQLFTMGLYELNDDGTQKLDANGQPIAAYSQDQVENLAHALTGWTYRKVVNGVVKCPDKGGRNATNYTGPMIPCDANHDSTSQALLNGFSTTAGGTAEQHLNQALDNIFKDNNTPPYICKQLIQHLVTSNPSPAYVKRVVNKFKNNGSNVRGDLAAVVRAILEDDEARGPVPPLLVQGIYGHLRSPILLITNTVRWLDGTTTAGNNLNAWSARMGQSWPRQPSVFSFYPPDNPLPDGSGLLGPEFAITSSATSLDRGNFLNQVLFSTVTGTTLNWSVVPDDPAQMVQWVDDNLMHDTATPAMKSVILDAITNANVPANKRKPLAVYLAMSSSDYQTER